MSVHFTCAKTTLMELIMHDPILYAELNRIVKVNHQFSTEGSMIFGFYYRWLLSKPDYSDSVEDHTRVSMVSPTFLGNGDIVQQKRNLPRIMRQCFAFALNSKTPSIIPRSLWECIPLYLAMRNQIIYTPLPGWDDVESPHALPHFGDHTTNAVRNLTNLRTINDIFPGCCLVRGVEKLQCDELSSDCYCTCIFFLWAPAA